MQSNIISMDSKIIPINQGPKVTIAREEAQDHPARTMVAGMLRDSGAALAPVGFKFKGMASVFFYESISGMDTIFITHTIDVQNLHEKQCDAGWKELGIALMSRFGRKPPKQRK